MTTDTTRYVALLRGINVGKARQVGMPRLVEVLGARGHGNVRTHLRSGNVLLDSPLGEAELVADLETAIEEEFGFAVPVVVRTGAEVAAVTADDPFASVAKDPARYLVTFFPEAGGEERRGPAAGRGWRGVPGPRPGALSLAPRRNREHPARRVEVGQAPRRPGTGRNWNTVTELAELAAEGDP